MTFGDLEMVIGDTAQWTGTIKSAAGVPVSLSGLTATFYLGAEATTATLTKVLTKPGGTGIVQLGPLAQGDTTTIVAGTYPYKVLLTDGAGGRTTVEIGKMTLIGVPNG